MPAVYGDHRAVMEGIGRVNRMVKANRYYFGLDLGQSQDYSALAILGPQRAGGDAVYHCRFL